MDESLFCLRQWIVHSALCQRKEEATSQFGPRNNVLSSVFRGHNTNQFVYFVDKRGYDVEWFSNECMHFVTQKSFCPRNIACYIRRPIQPRLHCKVTSIEQNFCFGATTCFLHNDTNKLFKNSYAEVDVFGVFYILFLMHEAFLCWLLQTSYLFKWENLDNPGLLITFFPHSIVLSISECARLSSCLVQKKTEVHVFGPF